MSATGQHICEEGRRKNDGELVYNPAFDQNVENQNTDVWKNKGVGVEGRRRRSVLLRLPSLSLVRVELRLIMPMNLCETSPQILLM